MNDIDRDEYTIDQVETRNQQEPLPADEKSLGSGVNLKSQLESERPPEKVETQVKESESQKPKKKTERSRKKREGIYQIFEIFNLEKFKEFLFIKYVSSNYALPILT